MKLEEIISISGKGGLFKIVSRTANGLIVESLEEKKRIPVFSSDSVSAFTDISIYTDEGSEPLQNILKTIFKKENGNKTISANSSPDKLKEYMGEILPNFDRDTVYVSHIKKLLKWYNLLQELNLIKDLVVDKEEKTEKSKTETKTNKKSEPKEKPKAKTTPKKKKPSKENK